MTVLFGLCVAATLAAQPVLVETGQFGTMDNALAVDARKREDFEVGHIPGAASLDVESLSEDRDGVSGLLKPMADVHALLAAAGLLPEKTLVLYTGQDSASDVKRATRLFWILEYAGYSEVRLLNGGLAKWKGEERPVESGASKVFSIPPAALSALQVDTSRYASRDAVQAKQGLVVDLRSAAYYTGEEKSGSAPRAGHIPGAKNRPGDDFLEGPYFTFKSPDAIREMLAADAGSPVITYCNTGRVASVGYAAYRIAGFDGVALYDGSMSEWASHEECPVATGAEE